MARGNRLAAINHVGWCWHKSCDMAIPYVGIICLCEIIDMQDNVISHNIATAIACIEFGKNDLALNILKPMAQYRYCTNRQLSVWMATRRAECYCGTANDVEIDIMTSWNFLHPFDELPVDAPDTDGHADEVHIRMIGDTEWHEPTVEYINLTERNVNLFASVTGDSTDLYEVMPGDRVDVMLTDDIRMVIGVERFTGEYCFRDGVPGIHVDHGQCDGINFLPTVFMRDCRLLEASDGTHE